MRDVVTHVQGLVDSMRSVLLQTTAQSALVPLVTLVTPFRIALKFLRVRK